MISNAFLKNVLMYKVPLTLSDLSYQYNFHVTILFIEGIIYDNQMFARNCYAKTT